MQQSGSDRPGQRAGAVGEEHHQDRRRQGEASPSSQRPAIAGADQPDGESGLAGRWARQELAQRDQIDEGLLAQPTAANDKLLAEIADMRDRTAERTDAELEEGPEHFERRARALVACNALVQSHAESSRLSANLPALPSGLEIFLLVPVDNRAAGREPHLLARGDVMQRLGEVFAAVRIADQKRMQAYRHD